MNKLFLATAAMFLLASHFASAQSDYLITTKGDTLRGIIKGASFKQIKYRENEAAANKKFKSTEVAQYYIGKDKATYVSRLMPNITTNIFSNNTDPIFLQLIEHGKIDLLKYTYTSYSGYPVPMAHTVLYWYAQKGVDPIIEIKTNQLWGSRKDRKSAFSDMLSNKPDLQERFLAEDKFNFEAVRRYVQEYNL